MTKLLEHIMQDIPCRYKGPADITIGKLSADSRQIEKGDLFVAVRGTQVDGHSFIPKAVEQGAKAIVCEKFTGNLPEGVTLVEVKDSAEVLGKAAANYYDNPSRDLHLVGVTGTNGKTSVATLLHRLHTKLGHHCGLLSTVKYLVGEKELEATHTTPDAVTIQRLLKEMVDAGCSHAFMEVSSHAIHQKRIAGLDFDVAIFTNITHDHLDYHKTFDEYIKAKKVLFDQLPEDAFAMVNVDDKNGRVMVQNTIAKVKTYGVKNVSDFKGKIIESHFDGMLMTINNKELWVKLIGLFNASNMLAVYGAASLLGSTDEEILRVLSTLDTVDGRFEYVRSNNGITAIVDYAHTPDALKNVLDTINEIRKEDTTLITVVGTGGDRDRKKRPVMGKMAADMSDKVLLTSDNPRSEDPDQIIQDMMEGVAENQRQKVLAITNRREAIRAACMMASPGDVILIAGKGHETYQEIKGVRTYFNDKQVVSEIFMVNNINPQ